MALVPLLFHFLIALLSISTPFSLCAKPKGLVMPVRQDAATNLLVATIHGRTPLVSSDFIVDFTVSDLWVNCETNYKSSTFSWAECGSPQCKTANTSYCRACPKVKTHKPFCHDNTCNLFLQNPVTYQDTLGEVAGDVLALPSTDGSNPGPLVKIPDFLINCAPSALVELGLPKGVQGVAGLSQGHIPLQNQLASRLGFKPIFTMCIPSTTNANGVIFFGSDGPYSFLPGVDVSQNLKYTPLTIDPFEQYYIKVESVKINQKRVPLNTSLLALTDLGSGGGTTLNTLLPYTILEGSIFKAIANSFANQLSKVPTVKPIAPFGLCYESKHFSSTLLGPGVPTIDIELKGQDAVWSIFGLNSMVEAKPGILCLAFVDGKDLYRASINIGIYQMKDIPLKFDLSQLRLGFGGPLSGARTHCENFNFTTTTTS